MSALDLAAHAKPIFLKANMFTRFADNESDLIVSSNSSLRHRLYDMDPAAMWAGTNEDDTVDETIEFGLWDPGAQSSRDVDFLALLGANLRSYDFDFSNDNGATYPAPNKQAITGQTAANKLISLSSAVAADRVKLTAHTAFSATPNAAKQIGLIVVSQALLQAPIGMTVFKVKAPQVKSREAMMYDKTQRWSYIYHSDASYILREFSVGFAPLTEAQADALEAAVMRPEPIIFIPFPGSKPGWVFQGRVRPETWIRDFISPNHDVGEIITFDFQETGKV